MNFKYPLLIDGGLSNVLIEQGCDLNQSLWSAKFLDINPEAIIKAHYTYLNSGAKCIITSSYQASIPGFIKMGYTKEDAKSLLFKSVDLAEIAVQRYIRSKGVNYKPIIAASIGPYGAYLANGSEYHGNYNVSDQALYEFHVNRIKLLDRSSADIFAFETIPSFQEAKVLSEILKHTRKSAWISFSCKDGNNLHDGTKIDKCASLFSEHSKVLAIGVNCTNPKYISSLIKSIKLKSGKKKIIVYPNSGESYDSYSKIWSGESHPNLFVKMAKEWLELGADIIGGCCRVGPSEIKLINEILINK